MADNPTLPGTLMEIIEKYPDSRRLDHPNFGDVCRTVYAKGVITDFEKIQDDPIEVKSRVKVTGEWGESDYIPLFFHPKAQYWDDETVLATDFDEEGGHFEKAWMSFRCGDEVVVLQTTEGDPDLKPVAVLAFADGVPRIGENIVRMACEKHNSVTNDRTIKLHNPSLYIADDDDPVGPDGVLLKLLKKEEDSKEHSGATARTYAGDNPYRLTAGSSGYFDDYGAAQAAMDAYIASYEGDYFNRVVVYAEWHWLDDIPYGTVVGDGLWWCAIWAWWKPYEVKVIEKTFKVGPILYLIQILHLHRPYKFDVMKTEWNDENLIAQATGWLVDTVVIEGVGSPDVETNLGQVGLNNIDEYQIFDVVVKAGIYTPELEKIISEQDGEILSPTEAFNLRYEDWTNHYEGMYDQTILSGVVGGALGNSWESNRSAILETIEIYVRAHTKSDLMAVGMWPKEEEE